MRHVLLLLYCFNNPSVCETNLSFVLKEPSLFGCVITSMANKASLMRLLKSGVYVSVSSSTAIHVRSMLVQCTCCSQLGVCPGTSVKIEMSAKLLAPVNLKREQD